MVSETEMAKARAALAARSKGASRTGGKGSVRRKKKVVKKSGGAADNSKLQNALRRLGVNQVTSVQEVQMHMDDDQCMVFNQQPRVQANISANTYVVSGSHEMKKSSEVSGPGYNIADLQRLMEMQKAAQAAGKGAAPAAEGGDDDIPDLVEDFEKIDQGTD